MKNLKLLLVSIHIEKSRQAMPLAAGLLKAQLDSNAILKNTIEVSIADFYCDTAAEDIVRSIIKNMPDLIGLSTFSWNRHLVLEICSIVKTRFPQTVLFAGGAEATALPVNLLESAPFDFVIKGEGEYALAGVMEKITAGESFVDVPGVFVKGTSNTADNNQWPVEDLDSLPSPFLEGVIDPGNYNGVLWELSRGCAFKCGFCFESRGIAGVRRYSLERLKKELAFFEGKKTNNIFVLDPTFNQDMKRAKDILRMIVETAPLIHFTFEVRSEFIDTEMAELFSMLNCSLQIGLQSAIPEVLSLVNRNLDPDAFASKISLLNASGVIFGFDLIYGLPGDTIAGFKQSLDYALGLQPNHLYIFPLAVLPGTALYDQAETLRLNFMPDAPYTLIASPGFSENDMAAAARLKNACDIFYNQGAAVGWFYMVLETLDIDASDLIEQFSVFLSSKTWLAPDTGEEIILMQSIFIQKLFEKHGKGNCSPVIDDLIRIHGALSGSLHAGPLAGPANHPVFDDTTMLKPSPGTFPLALNYNFDELMTVGNYTFDEFLQQYRPQKTYIVIYNFGGAVKTLVIDSALYLFLQSLAAGRTVKQIRTSCPVNKEEEIQEFIEHAIGEMMIFINSITD